MGMIPRSQCAFIHVLKLFEMLEYDEFGLFFIEQAWLATGPGLEKNIYKMHSDKNWRIFPSWMFYPVHLFEWNNYGFAPDYALTYAKCKKSYAIHWWMSTEDIV